MAKLVLIKLKCTGSRPNFRLQPHFNASDGDSIGSAITIQPDSPNVVGIPQNNNNPYNVSVFDDLSSSRLFVVDLRPQPDQPYGGGLLDAPIGVKRWCNFTAPPGYEIKIFYRITENAFSLTQSYAIRLFTLVSTFIREVAIATAIYFSTLFTLLTLPFQRSRLDDEIDESSNNVRTEVSDRSQDDSQNDSQDQP